MTNDDLDNLALGVLRKSADELRITAHEELSRYSAGDLAHLDDLALSLLKKVPDEIRRAAHQELSRYSAKDLAFYFKTECLGEDGDSDSQSLRTKRAILQDYICTTTLEFQKSYRRHLDGESVGEI